MHVQIVRFGLHGISHADYVARANSVAPEVARVPGLRAKLWLSDPVANAYGGVYVWDDPAAMQAYVDGPILAPFAASPVVCRFSTAGFGLLREPTELTHGDALRAA